MQKDRDMLVTIRKLYQTTKNAPESTFENLAELTNDIERLLSAEIKQT